ncbi:carbohydrate kinase family protein [Oceanibium sediminis]|uniref:carbohydrate kinase family protein n=1 Tax=Oceanibium sediminis TaxID=2026339 RepID=UPI000DD2F908|nr:PfkB family carbohydrate kinase [Oceanibium sediminis]
MTETPVILCVGRLYCDLIFTGLPRLPTMGTEVYASGLGVHAGGGAFITAAHLAALGHAAALSATLPAPPFRDVVIGEIAGARVDASFCADSAPGAEPQITVALAGKTDRAFVTRRVGPAFPAFTVQDIRTAGARHLHIGELATLAEHPELIDLARGAGATLSLDCGWDEGLEFGRAAELIAAVDVFLPNDSEIDMLKRQGIPASVAPLTVIKQGHRGASAIRGAEQVHEGVEAVAAIDTTGAGDAFNAGFLSGWLSGADLGSCLRSGNRRGHLAVSQRGGFRPAAAEAAAAPAVAGEDR